MTRHASAARDLAALLADASPDVARDNAATLAALQEETRTEVAALLRQMDEARPTPAAPACLMLTLPLPPSGNRYWRHYNGRTVVSAEARSYRRAVQVQALRNGIVPMAGPVAVTLTVYRARKAGDLDNYAKVLLDAMIDIAYADDSQIVELHLFRHDDKTTPRVEVEIRRATKGG